MRCSGLAAALLLFGAPNAPAQAWQSGNDIDLIRRAVAHRSARDADTLVTTWQAEAHGIIRSASVLDQGGDPVERVIRADELRVEVYGEAPNRSKQIIVAWRDTSFLPNRVTYHRDHLGIVANDFGATIRLGQGEEVRDVVHPLSEQGASAYLFAVGDTATLRGPAGTVRVVTVRVRPVSADSAATVGTLFLDVDRAALVRFQFTFTPSAYRDRTVEDITVTLDNALQANARWLPWRQSIVIRRGEALLDLPIRTVIRADWIIDNYQLGVRHAPDRFAGPFIIGPRGPQPGGAWSGAMPLDGLPATDADVADVGHAASAALEGQLLDGLPRTRLLAAGISDLIHVNRVQGVTLALGGRIALGASAVLRARIGVGLSDHRLVGGVELASAVRPRFFFPFDNFRLFADRTMNDAGRIRVISGIANSIGTLISGADYGDYVLVERVGFGTGHNLGGIRVAAEFAYERPSSVATAFAPVTGTARPNPSLGNRDEVVFRYNASKRGSDGFGWSFGFDMGGDYTGDPWRRLQLSLFKTRKVDWGDLHFRGEFGLAWGDSLPARETFALGGRGTLLGVPFRSIGGRRMALVDVAWGLPVRIPAPQFPYSRYVKLPSTIAPYLAAGIAGGDVPGLPWRGSGLIESVAGIRLDLWGPLLRIESGISLRTGRAAFTLDVHPGWWGLM